jgi:hypothetical protein
MAHCDDREGCFAESPGMEAAYVDFEQVEKTGVKPRLDRDESDARRLLNILAGHS